MENPTVQIKNLTFELGGTLLFSLENLLISDNSRIFISGPTGSGKSSFAKYLCWPRDKLYTTDVEEVLMNNGTGHTLSGAVLQKFNPVYVRQNPYLVFHPYFRIQDHFEDAFSNVETGSISDIEGVYEALRLLGISKPEEILSRKVGNISQGEAQRCAVVLAMIRPTKLLVLDEVTSNIDRKSSENLLRYVTEFCSLHRIGLIFISHEIRWSDKFFSEHFEIKSDKRMVPVGMKQVNEYHGVRRKYAGPQMIKLVDVRLFFPGNAHKVVLHVHEFYLGRKGVIGLSGISGIGKTTLARAILGEIPATGGTFYINGEEVVSIQSLARHYKVRYLPQSIVTAFNPTQFLYDSLKEICEANNTKVDRIYQLASELGLVKSLFQKYPDELSGGEIQRVGIVSMLLADPDIIIFDESFSSVHSLLRDEIWAKISLLQNDKDYSILVISHDTEWLDTICDEVFFL